MSLSERALEGPWTPRRFDPSDTPAVGALMIAAYQGTVDDEGETESDAVGEVERVVAGEYGPFLADRSFVVEDQARIVGASLVSLWEGHPLLAYTIVHPELKRRGIGTLLMAETGNALLSAGYSELELFVTEANEPALRLYRKLGFRVADRLVEPAPEA